MAASVTATTLVICRLDEVEARCPATTIASIVSAGIGSGRYLRTEPWQLMRSMTGVGITVYIPPSSQSSPPNHRR